MPSGPVLHITELGIASTFCLRLSVRAEVLSLRLRYKYA